jgi:hypothetical protein
MFFVIFQKNQLSISTNMNKWQRSNILCVFIWLFIWPGVCFHSSVFFILFFEQWITCVLHIKTIHRYIVHCVFCILCSLSRTRLFLFLYFPTDSLSMFLSDAQLFRFAYILSIWFIFFLFYRSSSVYMLGFLYYLILALYLSFKPSFILSHAIQYIDFFIINPHRLSDVLPLLVFLRFSFLKERKIQYLRITSIHLFVFFASRGNCDIKMWSKKTYIRAKMI